jgi:hypothetical protein
MFSKNTFLSIFFGFLFCVPSQLLSTYSCLAICENSEYNQIALAIWDETRMALVTEGKKQAETMAYILRTFNEQLAKHNLQVVGVAFIDKEDEKGGIMIQFLIRSKDDRPLKFSEENSVPLFIAKPQPSNISGQEEKIILFESLK